MLSTIIEKPHAFVLETERSLPPDEQTVFYIRPKTQRDTNQTAVDYAKAQTLDRRRGKSNIDKKALDTADLNEWLRAVIKIENVFVAVGSPEGAYDHFNQRKTENPTGFEEKEIEGVPGIIVKTTEDKIDIQYLFWALSTGETEEVMAAFINYGELRTGLKNA